VSLWALAVVGGWYLDTGRHTARPFLRLVLAAEPLPPGRETSLLLPSLTLPDLTGQEQALRVAPDEITVLNFWATWCVPCLKELPELVALHHQWQERGVHVVGVPIDSGAPADISAFATRQGMDYALRLGTQQWARSHFGIFGLPVTLVVDRHGQIRQRLLGPQTGAQFEAAIRPYL
jgi:thiol-disulfide isomerase/thioredoxin